jgi:hypothetical protein
MPLLSSPVSSDAQRHAVRRDYPTIPRRDILTRLRRLDGHRSEVACGFGRGAKRPARSDYVLEITAIQAETLWPVQLSCLFRS